MKISLRKANALQASINECIAEIPFIYNIAIDQFTDITSTMTEESVNLFKNFEERSILYDVLYEIRKKVSNANSISGINDLLTEIGCIDAKIKYTIIYANQKSYRLTNDELTKRVLRLSEQEKVGRYPDSVIANLLTKEEVDKFKKMVQLNKKRKQKLQDTLLELNIRTEIELDENSVEILKKYNLI